MKTANTFTAASLSQTVQKSAPISASPLFLGSLRLASRFVLAPLAGYTNLPFRLAIRELGGVGLATTDLVSARALLLRSRKTLELIQTTAADAPLAIQIYGAEAAEMRAAAQWLEAYGVAAVDINMGCPVHKVVRGGGGSALMCEPGKASRLVRQVVEAVRIPVTVKMRLGWDDAHLSAPFFAREFEEAGVAGVTIHGRSRAQGFSGTVSLDGIRAVVQSVRHIPVIGNGDVRTVADAARMLESTGCAALSIGRGALLNPWIFSQLSVWAGGRQAASFPTPAARVAFMARHFHLLVDQRGEHFACLTFRKVANWYCKVLRPGREVQQSLVRLDSIRQFEDLLSRIRDRQAAAGAEDQSLPFHIPVPSGPIERW